MQRQMNINSDFEGGAYTLYEGIVYTLL